MRWQDFLSSVVMASLLGIGIIHISYSRVEVVAWREYTAYAAAN
jgi:uncharacterized membrane protein YqgA involved in biofilm formation